jgi:hypothetical protein
MLPGTVAMRMVPGLSLAACTISLSDNALYGPSADPTQVNASVFT